MTYTIREYDAFTRNNEVAENRYTSLPEKLFDKLELFTLRNRGQNTSEPMEIFSISVRKGVGKIISAKNYVGLITMSDGTTIEILPKIYTGETADIERTKRTFLEILKVSKAIPYKNFEMASVETGKMNLFEIFIHMFVTEIQKLTKQGLKSDYLTYSNNENFYKGKLDFNEQLKKNSVHKQRFFVCYDVFQQNRVENRIIKAALLKLKGITTSGKNKRDIHKLLAYFEEIEPSIYYQSDFEQCKIDRGMVAYEASLKWSKIFLMNKSFTTFKGEDIAYALLFPMEKLFEDYIGTLLRRAMSQSQYNVSLQETKYYLFEKPKKHFSIRPDIIVRKNDNGQVIVLDTKWKVLYEDRNNYGISQGDMYQMYVYQKKYHAQKIILLYPLTGNIDRSKEIKYESNDGVQVEVYFIDLEQGKKCVQPMINELEKSMESL